MLGSHHQTLKFTIVDDDEHVLFFVERALRHAFPGSEITTFHDGTEALHHIQNSGTDLVITDQSMQHMNGAELIRELRKDGFNLPIIMISSSPNAEEEGTSAGATAFMEKDAAMKSLPGRITSLLKISQLR